MNRLTQYTLPIIFLAIVSCGEKEDFLFKGPNHVVFTEESSEILESHLDPVGNNFNDPLEIEIHLVSPLLNATTTIEYTVSGSAIEGVDYVIDDRDKEILIGAGRSTATITIIPVNNRELTGDKQIFFQISSVNNDIEIGRNQFGSLGNTHTTTIRDDDCLVQLSGLEGTWEFKETDVNEFEVEYEVEIVVDYEQNNRILISNFAGLDTTFVAYANLNLCNRRIFLPEQFLVPFNQDDALLRTEEGGVFDEESGTMIFTYTLNAFGSNDFSVVGRKND